MSNRAASAGASQPGKGIVRRQPEQTYTQQCVQAWLVRVFLRAITTLEGVR